MRRLFRVLGGGSSVAALEAENAVLRHELAVLRRTVKRPPLRRRERLMLAAASALLPRERWSVFRVKPQTLLSWHRELVARKWTYRHPQGQRMLACDFFRVETAWLRTLYVLFFIELGSRHSATEALGSRPKPREPRITS